MSRLRVLAIAAATGRIGYVFLIGGKLRDWGLSRKASKSPGLAKAQAETWIDDLAPDVVVTEDVSPTSTKGSKTKRIIAAIREVAERANVLDIAVKRWIEFKNKYEEAIALGDRFPEIKAWVPRKRKIWEPEPRNTIYFEALALALVIIDGRKTLTQYG